MNIGSDPVDAQDFQFKLQCRLKIFENAEKDLFRYERSLLATASRFGLVFVGNNSPKFKVIKFLSIEENHTTDPNKNYPCRDVDLPFIPQHISINCDHTILAVICVKNECPVVLFYDVQSFFKQNIVLLNEVRLSTTPGVRILEANWHPTIGNIFTECKSDGTLGTYELKGTSVDMNKLPSESNATCFCWSPKGKQIAVGSRDGKLTHYKPDLKAVKIINAPPFEKPFIIISLQWVSNYQFIGVYKPSDESDNQCNVVVIDAPKTGNTVYTNFYDVCYSNGSLRVPQFYLIFEQSWNILILASSNSMEVGVMARGPGDVWTQWSLADSARAELPLDQNREETYPIGMAFDISSTKAVTWGESSLPPAPSLLMLSHRGVLCSFRIVNLKEGVVSLNAPPDDVADKSGSNAFVIGSGCTAPVEKKMTQEVANKEVLPSDSSKSVQENKVSQVTEIPKSMFNLPMQKTPVPPSSINFSTLAGKQPIQTPQAAPPINPNSLTMFGGQVTITPAINKEKDRSNSASIMGSGLLSNSSVNKPLMETPGATMFSNAKPPQFTAAQQPSIFKSTMAQPPTTVQTVIPQSTPKPQIESNVQQQIPTEVIEKPEVEPLENNEEIDSILAQMIQMERTALENELKAILYHGKQLKIELDPKDKEKIMHNTKNLEDFMEELNETSESQSSEVHILKQNMIQAWAWLEEAKSRLKESRNKEIQALMKSRPLDSVSEKHLQNLKQMEFYLDSQLAQAHRALDEQWDKFQEHCKKLVRVQLPTMEAIFQTMVKQNAIVQKHDYILKDLTSRVKGRKKDSNQTSLFHSPKNKSLEDSFQNLKLEPNDIHRIYYQKVLNRVRTMPAKKSNQLRRHLHDREVPHVTVKSQIANSILQTTPEGKIKSICANVTPVATKAVKKLDFHQSTPLNIQSEKAASIINSSPLSAFVPANNRPEIPLAKTTNEINNLSKQTSKPTFFVQTPQNGGFTFGKQQTTCSKSDVSQPSIVVPKSLHPTSSASNIITVNLSKDNQVSKEMFPSITIKPMVPSSSTNTAAVTSLLNLQSTETSAKLSEDNKSILFSSNVTQQSSYEANPTLFAPIPTAMGAGTFTAIPANSTVVISKQDPPLISKTSIDNAASLKVTTTVPVSEATPVNSIASSASSKSIFGIKSLPISNPGIFGSKSTSGSMVAIAASSSSASGIASNSLPFASVANMTFVNPATAGPTLFSKTIVTTTVSSVSSTNNSQSIFSNVVANSAPKAVSSPPVDLSHNSKAAITTAAETPTSSKEYFSTTTSTSEKSKGPIFGNVPSTISTSSLFGNSSTPTSNVSSTLSTSVATTTSTTSTLFGTATPVTNKSIFGTATISGSQSLFGTTSAPISKSDTSTNVFGNKTVTSNVSVFGSVPSSNSSLGASVAVSTTAEGSPFGTVTSSSSLFGNVSSSTNVVKTSSQSVGQTTTASLFGAIPSTLTPLGGSTTSSSSPLFGNTSQVSTPFGATTTSSSLFGNVSSSGFTFGSTVTSASTFGSTAVTSSIFGNVTTSASPFGSATSSASPFGGAATSASSFGSATSSASPFGGATTSASPFGSATTTGSLFGSATTTSSLFGNVPTSTSPFGNTTTSSSPFGSVKTTNSLFGSAASSSSPFGNSVTSSSSPFGASTTSTSPFGATATSSSPFGTASTTASPFGATATSPFGAPATTASLFGVPATTVSPFGATATTVSPFGATSTTVSPFGQASATSSSIFGSSGQAGASTFGKPAVFGQANTFGGGFGSATTTTANVFGQQQNPTASGAQSVFGGTVNSFGGSNSSPFGAPTSSASASPFGTSSGGSLFGTSSNVFGAAASNSDKSGGNSFGFGSLNMGATTAQQQQSPFGAKSESKSPFGGVGSFNTTASSGSLFGSSSFGSGNAGGGGSIFGQSTFGAGAAFGASSQQQSGPFSGGSDSVAQTGFGAATAFQKPSTFGSQSTFGSSPTFGGSPAFGAAPTFGGSPAFGNTSPFGSPNKVFGAASPGVFNTNNQSSPGFGNLANQNTVGFGNLAQSTNNSNQAGFSGNPSFSSWR